MKTLRMAGLTAFLTISLAAVAQAQTLTFYYPLDGGQEVPPKTTAGNGVALVTLDTATNLLTWHVSFQSLTTSVTAAHFHGPALPGQNAGVQVGIAGAGATSPIVGSATITNTQKADLLAGKWYTNVHTTMNTGGEIRGQVIPGCPFMIGDANCDGAVDFFDIDSFIDALLNGTSPCSLCALDANGDGILDFFDIDPFMACVLAGGC